MVNAARNNSYETPDITVDLGPLKGDPLAEQAAAAFIASMKGSHAQRLLNLAIPTNGHTVSTADQRAPFKHGCSPSDWFNDEAQMTRGGTGKGGNWID